MIRLGLCCSFRDEPIKFANTTATALGRLTRESALLKLSKLVMSNARSLIDALHYCRDHRIGCFRVVSQILPLKTHPTLGYDIMELPQADEIIQSFQEAGKFANENDIRTCFHPDQFVVLNSPRPEVLDASIREIEYQTQVAIWVNADVINIHGGGAYGDKARALDTFKRNLDRLSPAARGLLTVENDDKIFSPSDLLPLCRDAGLPLVYDVHHHRCHGDEFSEEEATELAMATWNRQPMFHISSPLEGWSGPKPHRHHDFIDPKDFPFCWRKKKLTVEVEAKAKESAVRRLMEQLKKL